MLGDAKNQFSFARVAQYVRRAKSDFYQFVREAITLPDTRSTFVDTRATPTLGPLSHTTPHQTSARAADLALPAEKARKLKLSIGRARLGLACLWVLGCVLGALAGRAEEKRILPGHVPAVVSQLRPIEQLAATNRMRLAIGLPLRDKPGLNNLLKDLYDPASPRYRKYLSAEEFAERHGPSRQDYAAVATFAASNGLSVARSHPNRMLLDVIGSVGDVERTFGVRLHSYQHPREGRRFFAPDTEPSVPAGLPILDIGGLNNYSRPRRAQSQPMGGPPVLATNQWTGSGPYGSFMAADLRAAYAPGVTLTGAGQSVAIVALDGYYASNITNYERLNNLPNISVVNVLIDGAEGKPETTSVGNTDEEVSMDIEMAIAMAPGLSRVLVYVVPEGAGTCTLYNDMLNRIATDNLAKQISCSFVWTGWKGGLAGWVRAGNNQTTDQIFQQFAAQGQSYFTGSGDWGAYNGDSSVTWWTNSGDAPILTSPYITIVGGTSLTTAGPGGAWESETTWNYKALFGSSADSSGGMISTSYPIPPWQQGVDMSMNGGSTSMRNTPDVAMLADGIFVCTDQDNGDPFGAGTSAAAPLWAGFTALINQQAEAFGQPPVGFLNPAIYALGRNTNYAACFHDITTGNNTNSLCPTNFFAMPGYDLCTGWGTPTGQPLINALATPDLLGILPGSGFSAANGPVGPFNITSQTFVLTNGGTTIIPWSLCNTCAWLNVSCTNGTLAPAAPTGAVTISLNSIADSLAPGTNPATVWFTNLATGYVQSRNFTLLVRQPLVQNGAFTVPDVSGWLILGAQVNDLDPTYVGTIWATGGPLQIRPNSKVYGFQPDQFLPLRLEQDIPTVPGQTYCVSLTLLSGWGEFGVSWGGRMLLDLAAPNTTGGWPLTNITCIATACSK